MKILITEQQFDFLTEDLAWKKSVIEHILNLELPITDNITKMLFEQKKIRTFHISDTKNINNMKNIIGTNKVLSTFNEITRDGLKKIAGIKTYGSILYEIEGTLVFSSDGDIYSKPDENGMRWVGPEYLFPTKVYNEWSNEVHEHDVGYRQNLLSNKNTRTEYIRNYFNIFKKYIKNYKNDVLKYVSEKHYDPENKWNEILVKNIKIIDVIFDEGSLIDMYREQSEHVNWLKNNNYKLTSKQEEFLYTDKDYWSNVFAWLNKILPKIKNQLDTISTGTVYLSDENNDVVKFFLDRGGKILY